MPTLENDNLNGEGGNALKQFQTTTKIKSKSDKEFGLKVVKSITDELKGAHITDRNIRFAKNRQIANGRQSLEEFKAYFAGTNKDGSTKKVEYIKLQFKAIKIVSTAISRMVGRWMQGTEKIVVTAEDSISIKQKQDEYDAAEYYMETKPLQEELTQASGMPVVPQQQFVPEDKDELDSWAKEQQRLPEEIKFEQGVNEVLNASGWFDVIKEKVLTDSAEVGLVGCEVYAQKDGMIMVEWIAPESLLYSKSIYPDFRDTTWRGRVKKFKIIEIREEYPNLSEEEFFAIAQKSNQYSSSGIYGYDNDWNSSSSRPYDDWSVNVIIVYIKTSDSDGYTMKVSKAGTLFVDKTDKQPTNGNKSYIKKDKYCIYKGVYVQDTEILLEWAIQKNMIRPQSPTEIGDCEFPISLYMYNMYNMRNLAIPEKVEEPVDALILTRLKIQQLISTMSPAGNAYDVDALRELDLGEGIMSPLKLSTLHKQTGNFYFSSKDAEGNRIEFPIKPLQNSEGLTQLQGLIAIYNHHLDVFRQEIGENENAEGQSAKPRVSTDNYQASLSTSYNAVDYMQRAYLYLLEDVSRKVSCLLHDSVSFGAQKYRKIMQQDDVKGRIFNTKHKMLPQESEIAYLDTMINQSMQANPTFVLYADPLKLRRLARENVKLAEIYLRSAQRRALKGQMDQAQSQSKMNSDAQVASANAASEAEMKMKEFEAGLRIKEIGMQGENANKNLIITMFTQLFGKGVSIPKEIAPLASAAIQNMLLPLITQNEEQKQQIIQAMAEQQQQAQQPQEAPQEGMEQQPMM
jgi:hypothetical protein